MVNKKTITVLLLGFCIAAGISACGKPKQEKTEPTAAAVEDALHNITYEEVVEKTGIDLPAPEGAENVSYHVLLASTDKPIAEMDFTLDGQTAYLRAQSTDWVPSDPGIDAKPEEIAAVLDTEHLDISGLNYKWSAMGTADIKGRSGMFCLDKKTGFIAWIDIVPGFVYNLCMKENADSEILMNLAEKVFVPMQGDN